MRPENLCLGCMSERVEGAVCPVCSWNHGQEQESALYLPPGSILHGKYLIGRVLGIGGFGITYLAFDLVLNIKLCIKEFLPKELATRAPGQSEISIYTGENQNHFQYGLEKFLEEAQALAKFVDHPGIVSVRDYFKGNNTAYLVMLYVAGMTFRDYLKKNNDKIDYQTALNILMPVMDALREVHKTGLLHRDIAPDNIYITQDGQVRLLDFGAARYSMGKHSKSLSVILKPGYAPEEQYRSKGKQGAWTDLYAVAATFYRAITGIRPIESNDRKEEDTLVPPSRAGVSLPPHAEAALLKAMSIRAADRFQCMKEFQQALLEEPTIDPPTPTLPGPTTEPTPIGDDEEPTPVAPKPTKSIESKKETEEPSVEDPIPLVTEPTAGTGPQGEEKKPPRGKKITKGLKIGLWVGLAVILVLTVGIPLFLKNLMVGRLYVNVLPRDAIIRIDRKSSWGGIGYDGGSYHYEDGVKLPVDEYRLEVSGSGYTHETMYPKIVYGKDTRLKITLHLKKLTNNLGMEFVCIKPGWFEREGHTVSLKQYYYLQTTEVTQGQWRAVMGKNPSVQKDCGDNCPVTKVSWEDVQEFIRELNRKEKSNKYRLPTEAEWEYACHALSLHWGTSQPPFSTGKCLSTNQANYNGDYPFEGCTKGESRKKPLPVAGFSPNVWGLHDMHGNVFEYCADWYGEYSSYSESDPKGPSSGSERIIRGGSFASKAASCRSATRSAVPPDKKFSDVGFRLAITPES